ncbi:hypothetical protein ACW9H6_05660 [Pseudomonas sp. SDO528_S397]
MNNRWRVLVTLLMGWTVSGCSSWQTEYVTLQTQIPDNFTVTPVVYYESASDKPCWDRRAVLGEPVKAYKPFEYKLPLTEFVSGCSMRLKSVVLHIEGQWDKRELDMSLQRAGLSIKDRLPATTEALSEPSPMIFQGQCRWYFRTKGPRRFIRKILECRKLDEKGVEQKSLPGGSLQRDQLAGKTVTFKLTVADEELPYFGPYWINTAKGWKPCKGNWGRDMEELCITPPQFKTFKMPDGRDCTVYPNCTE